MSKIEEVIDELEQVKEHFGEPENYGIASAIIDNAIEEIERLGKIERETESEKDKIKKLNESAVKLEEAGVSSYYVWLTRAIEIVRGRK